MGKTSRESLQSMYTRTERDNFQKESSTELYEIIEYAQFRYSPVLGFTTCSVFTYWFESMFFGDLVVVACFG